MRGNFSPALSLEPPHAPKEGSALLLHVCCGPCAIMPVQRLLEAGYAVTLWYMNPNIHPLMEYLRRREAVGECAERLNVPVLYADDAWDVRAWLEAPETRKQPPARCQWCCQSRLEAAASAAKALGFGWFSTSLLYSRYQPHADIAAKGKDLTDAGGVQFVYGDFREDWQAGIDHAKAWGLYRQPYCGCIFSEAERYGKKLARCIMKGSGI